jgi:PBP1b-binding outer membrane lipoprotein LpoB
LKEYIFILSALLLLSCSNEPTAKDIARDNYRKAPQEQPQVAVSPDAEPEVVVIDETEVEVDSGQTAREAFEQYASEQGLDYDYVSSEQYQENGRTYYMIIYEYDELGGGKDEIIIDSEGKVYREYGII